MISRICRLLVAIFVFAFLGTTFPISTFAEGEPTLLISEIQTGGCTTYNSVTPSKCDVEAPLEEFVELYNPLNSELGVVGWKIQYVSASGGTITDLVVLNGNVQPQSYVLLAHEGYFSETADLYFSPSFAKSGGHIRIINSMGQIIDLVGWGTASATVSWPKVSEIAPGYSAKRILPGDPLYGMGIVFTPSTQPTTPSGGGYVIVLPPEDEEESENEEGGLGAGSSCEGVIISELLSNPSGSDSDKEFIELFNPTQETITLLGCKLQTSANSKIFEFTDGQIEPGQYLALYNNETGLTLANSSGGTVFLIDSDNTEIYQVDYDEDLGDDVSWSLIDSNWFKTFSITPDAPNQLLESKTCPAGQTRNPETDRCINIVEATGLAVCKIGQERNPETNRCRNIASLASALKACATDQERNPETNRCRKVASASSLTPCKPGQERNPETNRCRNASGSSSDEITDVKDVLSATSTNKTSWLVAIGAVLAALSYAIWEWRNELIQLIAQLKNKFSFN